MARESANNIGNYRDISIQNRTQTITDQISGSGFGHLYRFRTTQRSRIDLTLKRSEPGRLGIELIQDQNRNKWIDPGEIIATSRAPGKKDRIRFAGLDPGEYLVRIFPETRRSPNYQLTASAKTGQKIDPNYRMLLWTNRLRRQNDLPGVALNMQLSKAARQHSRSMANNNFFSHVGLNGSQPGDRIQNAKYRYAQAAENIATGQNNNRATFDWWKNNAASREILLDSAYEEMGINLARQSSGSTVNRYWSQTFGAPAVGSIYPNIPPTNWHGSFLNRSANNYSDFKTYNFRRPDAVIDLGGQGQGGARVARLKLDYGTGSPAPNIQTNRFAMEAWTRITLEEGKFYRVTSRSDDGTRFYVKSATTQKKLANLGGDWKNRSVRDPAWRKTFTASAGGSYDFYVQYYENTGASVVDVTIEQVTFQGQVGNSVSGLNLRSRPSTLNNNPMRVLSGGTGFTLVGKVSSPDDNTYKDWYEVQLSDGTRGYIVADNQLVSISGAPGTIININDPSADKNPIGGGGGNTDSDPIPTGTGYISPRVLKTSDGTISFRTGNTLSSPEIARLGANTPLKILGKSTGDYYLTNLFDEWYKVSATVNGQTREGYVAAYYVDVPTDGKTFSTAISKSNPYYMPHLQEATNPYYYHTSYKPYIDEAAALYNWLSPSIIAGIGSRESGWGLFLSPKGPTGTGDGGHGRGLMQIDDRYHQTFINSGRWTNPRDNIIYGVDKVLAEYYSYLGRTTSLTGVDLLRGAIAAYNAGPGNVERALREGRDIDYYTTGRDYSWDVLNRAGWFQLHGWA
jgi:uncharacterized protein YkwD